MKKTYVIIALVIGIAVAGLVGYKVLLGDDADEAGSQKPATSQMPATDSSTNIDTAASASETKTSEGRYTSYSSEAVADQGYSTTVVFFFAPWCPECQAFKKAIDESDIPAGTQILEASYDNETELKSKYGVTIQTTFVRVNSNGDLQKKWVGYNKDKSLQAVLDNVN